MARFAVIDDGVVVGVMSASSPPSIDVPVNRLFVNVQDLPDIKGGEIYDPLTGIFSQPEQAPTLLSRLDKIELTVQDLQAAAVTPKSTTPPV